MSHAKTTHQQLIAYAAGELRGADARQVQAHLERDADAARTVHRYRLARQTVLGDDGVDPPTEVLERARAIFDPTVHGGDRRSLVESVGDLIAKLIFDSRAQPALAGLRGQATSFQMTWQLAPESGMELDLQAELTDVPDGDRWQLVGQVTSRDSIGPLTVNLCHAGSIAAAHSVDADERGSFVLRVEPGLYDLHLQLRGGRTVVPDIRLS